MVGAALVVIRSDVGGDELENGRHNSMFYMMMEDTNQISQGAEMVVVGCRGHNWLLYVSRLCENMRCSRVVDSLAPDFWFLLLQILKDSIFYDHLKGLIE
ncbi:hypothetical protein QVD17_38069 [Tagetes erecta]|uniref:Uncharacterized protein n=1 Tax=Tagetes erecta TaxID=13708 RepID=A0AAD8JVC7_TARER|nr:hypothetical protein QVD17_38069 [Tagetes erecta]